MSYQSTPQDDKLARTQRQVDEVQGVMRNNIAKTIDRGENLNELEYKANRLEQSAQRFQKQATELKWAMCYQSWRNLAIIFILLAVVIILIVWALGGFK